MLICKGSSFTVEFTSSFPPHLGPRFNRSPVPLGVSKAKPLFADTQSISVFFKKCVFFLFFNILFYLFILNFIYVFIFIYCFKFYFIYLFNLFNLFIFGCVGSSFLCEGFL